MILEFSQLLDGNYIFVHATGTPPSQVFYGSRIELLAYLADTGFSDAEIELIMLAIDSKAPVNLPASCQGYC
jgi:hypothetical protein